MGRIFKLEALRLAAITLEALDKRIKRIAALPMADNYALVRCDSGRPVMDHTSRVRDAMQNNQKEDILLQ
jgi:hypothetical protein